MSAKQQQGRTEFVSVIFSSISQAEREASQKSDSKLWLAISYCIENRLLYVSLSSCRLCKGMNLVCGKSLMASSGENLFSRISSRLLAFSFDDAIKISRAHIFCPRRAAGVKSSLYTLFRAFFSLLNSAYLHIITNDYVWSRGPPETWNKFKWKLSQEVIPRGGSSECGKLIRAPRRKPAHSVAGCESNLV